KPEWFAQQAQASMQAVVSNIRWELEILIREQDAFPASRSYAGEEVFVVVAASANLKPPVDHAIAPAVADNGLIPFVMVSREPDEGSINSAILAHIDKAKLLVADLTHERPNCYYE